MIGWSRHAIGYAIAYNIVYTEQELLKIIRTKHPYQDGGPPMSAEITLVDAGEGFREANTFLALTLLPRIRLA